MDFFRLIGVYVFFILMIDTYMHGGNFWFSWIRADMAL